MVGSTSIGFVTACVFVNVFVLVSTFVRETFACVAVFFLDWVVVVCVVLGGFTCFLDSVRVLLEVFNVAVVGIFCTFSTIVFADVASLISAMVFLQTSVVHGLC